MAVGFSALIVVVETSLWGFEMMFSFEFFLRLSSSRIKYMVLSLQETQFNVPYTVLLCSRKAVDY